MRPAPTTLKRPAEKLLRNFHIGQVGHDTIQTYLEKGFSLAICCRYCPRIVEWTPPELHQRFGTKLRLRIADLVPRLSCAGTDGCGSHDIAVYPHLYEGPWVWPPQA